MGMNRKTAKLIFTRALAFTGTFVLSMAIVNLLPSTRNQRQRSFAQAAMDGNLNRMRLLHLAGADINVRGNCCLPLYLAAGEGRLEVVRYLLDEGADVNAREAFGRTALSEAVFYGRGPVVKELVFRGADLNVIGEDGTALDIAIKKNNPAVVDLLRRHGGKSARELGSGN
jgi:ankyrin repeat protein